MDSINLKARRVEDEIIRVINSSEIPACIACFILDKLAQLAKEQLMQIEKMELEYEQKSEGVNANDQSNNATVSNQN